GSAVSSAASVETGSWGCASPSSCSCAGPPGGGGGTGSTAFSTAGASSSCRSSLTASASASASASGMSVNDNSGRASPAGGSDAVATTPSSCWYVAASSSCGRSAIVIGSNTAQSGSLVNRSVHSACATSVVTVVIATRGTSETRLVSRSRWVGVKVVATSTISGVHAAAAT